MQIFTSKNFIFLSVLLFLTACNFEDKPRKISSSENAEKVIDRFHNLLQEGKYAETQPLFTTEFKKVTPWKKMKAIYKSCEKLGDVKYKMVKSSRVDAAPDGFVTYNLLCEVTRTNFNSVENYTLIEEGGKIKINSFNIQSEAFNQ